MTFLKTIAVLMQIIKQIVKARAGLKTTRLVSASKQRRSLGFTLLEVMVAIGILGTLGIVLLSTTSRSTQNIATMQNKIEALSIAEYALNTVLIDEEMPELGTDEVVVSRAGQRWLVRVSVSETPNELVFRVDTLVKPDDLLDGQEQQATVLLSGFKTDLSVTP